MFCLLGTIHSILIRLADRLKVMVGSFLSISNVQPSTPLLWIEKSNVDIWNKKSHPLKKIPWLLLPGRTINLGVIPGYTLVVWLLTGFPQQRYWTNRKTARKRAKLVELRHNSEVIGSRSTLVFVLLILYMYTIFLCFWQTRRSFVLILTIS